jgi:hypothetical protein
MSDRFFINMPIPADKYEAVCAVLAGVSTVALAATGAESRTQAEPYAGRRCIAGHRAVFGRIPVDRRQAARRLALAKLRRPVHPLLTAKSTLTGIRGRPTFTRRPRARPRMVCGG